MNKKLPNILVFMSDQHQYDIDINQLMKMKMPNLEYIKNKGVCFSEAYTSCPLCVPARMSMLSSKLPSVTGIYTNEDALPEREVTFLHRLVEIGYETVLVGRMHFVGTNQRHGFTKRIAKDITPVTWNRPVRKLKELRGSFDGCFGYRGSEKNVVTGDSPVLAYDRYVIKKALDYLSMPHNKPQCIFVSVYGPHFPYCAPFDRYKKYRQIVDAPKSFGKVPDYFNSTLKARITTANEKKILDIRATYLAMISVLDDHIGTIYKAYQKYLNDAGSKGIFCYLSDHGDQAGEQKIIGKMTFFDSSAKIPLIFEGEGIVKNKISKTPVSIMDLGPTLCELVGCEKDSIELDGRSLASFLTKEEEIKDHGVISEVIDEASGNIVIGRMLRKEKYKYIAYHKENQSDMLFDLENDPHEELNIIESKPVIAEKLKKQLYQSWEPEKLLKEHINHKRKVELIRAWEKSALVPEKERWEGEKN